MKAQPIQTPLSYLLLQQTSGAPEMRFLAGSDQRTTTCLHTIIGCQSPSSYADWAGGMKQLQWRGSWRVLGKTPNQYHICGSLHYVNGFPPLSHSSAVEYVVILWSCRHAVMVHLELSIVPNSAKAIDQNHGSSFKILFIFIFICSSNLAEDRPFRMSNFQKCLVETQRFRA